MDTFGVCVSVKYAIMVSTKRLICADQVKVSDKPTEMI